MSVAPQFRASIGQSLALFWILIILFVCLGANWLAPYDPTAINLRARFAPPVFAGGSWAHPFGTDNLGRDTLSRLMYSAQLSMFCALLGTVIGGIFGTLLGLIAARWKVADAIVSSAIDFQAALPFLVFAIAVLAIFGNSLFLFIMILGVFGWERYARLARNLAKSAYTDGYALTAKSRGASTLRIWLHHILPNILGVLAINVTLNFPQTILLESGISFLGIGVQPPLSSLGTMLGFSRDYLSSAWWLAVMPGVVIFLTTLSIGTCGTWLADWLDPKRRAA